MQAAKQIQCSLEYTTLKRITQTTEIYYDPDPTVSPCPCTLIAAAGHSDERCSYVPSKPGSDAEWVVQTTLYITWKS